MKSLVLILALCGIASARLLQTSNVAPQFENWMSMHNKEYVGAEREHRMKIYHENMGKVLRHNQDPTQTYKMALNQFADLTTEEFIQRHLSVVAVEDRQQLFSTAAFEYSSVTDDVDGATVDWTPMCSAVKNQGQCGSCWAFSTTGAIEAQYKIRKNMSIILSEQELMDCSWEYGNEGCNGGLMTSAFEYIEKKGIHENAADPYTARDSGSCPTFKSTDKLYKINSHVVVQENETALACAVATQGPVSVAVDATYFQFYRSGIFTSCGRNYQLNHGVLAVGYGTSGSTPYWIIKNSWGKNWGEKGYIRVKKGVNMCGIRDMAAFPLL